MVTLSMERAKQTTASAIQNAQQVPLASAEASTTLVCITLDLEVRKTVLPLLFAKQFFIPPLICQFNTFIFCFREAKQSDFSGASFFLSANQLGARSNRLLVYSGRPSRQTSEATLQSSLQPSPLLLLPR